ncbi:LysM peptidoglycan-binding domain-containing protein [Nocardioides sp. AN3]
MSTVILTPTRVIQPRRPMARQSTLRLTRRGRMVVFLVGFMVALVAGFVLAGGSTASEHSESTTTIQVGPGETLWDIAQSVAVKGHTADMVEHIKELNGLKGSALQAGEELRVPLAS